MVAGSVLIITGAAVALCGHSVPTIALGAMTMLIGWALLELREGVKK